MALTTKWQNILNSFWHKSEGNLVTATEVLGNGDIKIHYSNGTNIEIVKYVLPSDIPISYIQNLATSLDGKVDKIAGKSLSDHNYDSAAVTEVAKVINKVDKVAGLGLSKNDYNNTAKTIVDRMSSVYKRIDNPVVTGNYNIDWSIADTWKLTLTGNTTITQSNLPTGTNSKTITLYITGAFSLTFPVNWVVTSGTYDGVGRKQIVVECIDGDNTDIIAVINTL